ncbi:MAG: type IV secretion system protein [Xanthomonadaceae bacterium]|nr:type IV secretion system protein [Xanthomonadaceae bacterium]MDE1964033.1 type IV secretion system protein [Xanthomonadaceae bacterium]
MNVKKSPAPAIDRAVARSVNFELTIAELARRSERRAWMVAFCAIGLALILAGGYFYMLPLKQKVPYLVMADAYTGTATVAHLNGNFGPHGITANEAINRSNVAHFVLARESYDLAMLNLGDWKTVQTMASPGVKAAYMAEYSSQNPDSLFKQYGKERAIRIRLLSIVLLGGGAGRPPRGATVRFQRSLYDKATGATHPMENKIATLEFTYKPNLEMDDQSRIENPLGFWVTSYRVDNDYASAPPPEVAAGPVPTVVEPQAAPVASQSTPPATSATTSGTPAEGAQP